MTFLTLIVLATVLIAVCAAVAWSFAFERRAERRWTPEGRFIDAGGHRLHIRQAGASGPAIVLIHGAGGSAREIMWLIGDKLAREARVYALDRPGFGASPAMGGRIRLKRHAEAVAAMIAAEGLERPIVIGHSYGGAVALRLAVDNPGLASSYLLLGTASHGDVGPVAGYNHIAAAPLIGGLFCRTLPALLGPARLKAGAARTFHPDAMPEGYVEAAAIAQLFRAATFRANARDLSVVNSELKAQSKRYCDITEPVVLIAGGRDKTVLTKGHSERLATVLPNAQLAVLPDSGHMPHAGDFELMREHLRALTERRG